MTDPQGNTRKIQFPINEPLSIEAITPDEAIVNETLEFWPTTDNDEQITLAIKLSLNEYVALATCVDIGRDIAYGDNSEYLWWLWARILQGMCTVDCDGVTDCIENDEGVQNALSQFTENYLTENGYQSNTDPNQPTPLKPAQTAENLLPGDVVCDDDHLYAIARGIIANIHDGAIALFQELELITNPNEFIAQFVDNVEVVSWIGSIIEFVSWTQDQMIEYYEQSWSTVVHDDLSCQLWCLMRVDCELTIDMLLNLYQANMGNLPQPPFQPQSIDDVANYLLDLSLSVDITTVAVVHWFVVQALRFQSDALYFVAGIRSFKQALAYLKNDTDGDWVNCPDCQDVYYYNFDFTQSDGGWMSCLPGNQWVQGVGWKGLTGSGTNGEIRIVRNASAPALASVVKFRVYYTIAGGNGTANITLKANEGSNCGGIPSQNRQAILNLPNATDEWCMAQYSPPLVSRINPSLNRLIFTILRGTGSGLTFEAIIHRIEIWTNDDGFYGAGVHQIFNDDC